MLRGYRGIVAALVGLTTIGGGVGFGLFQQGRYEQEAQHRHADYTRHAADQIRQGCTVITPPQQAQCLANAVDEYALKARDNQREYDDLVAQRKSALWTSIMGVAALLGMLLSAVGVLLVWTTFQETKRTNQIALRENARATRRAVASGRESALALDIAQRNADAAARQVEVAQETTKRQLRAYVSFTSITQTSPLTVGREFAAKIRFVNHGHTPAHRVTVICWMEARRLPFDPGSIPVSVGTQTASSTQGPSVELTGIIQTPAPIDQDMYDANYENDAVIFCAGQIAYIDAFGDSHTTGFRLTAGKGERFDHCDEGNEAD